jgi:hypothetical protein
MKGAGEERREKKSRENRGGEQGRAGKNRTRQTTYV